MKRSPEERAQTERYEEHYAQALPPVMVSIERSVCGCDYGGSSWTTSDEAEWIVDLLALEPGSRLLDVGAGTGWPALYMADRSGCDVTLLDLPVGGLRIAADRAITDQLTGACWFACANASAMPFGDASFDALSHSDLLCCLKQKRAVLESCKRVIRPRGRMVFTVISIAENLRPAEQARALDAAPEFAESEANYSTLLVDTGWKVQERQDISLAFADSCRRQLKADKDNKAPLQEAIGRSEYTDRQSKWAAKLAALNDSLLQRELFVATPA